ncbi:MAG: amidohydrolase family protein [Chloroflexota bacterium]|nr:amidohydrolase family protein [Chloroflexota bacterium]
MRTIIHARYTLRGGVLVDDLAITVDGDAIVDAGTLTELGARYPAADRVGGDDYILAPGFTNAHDHGRALGTLALGVADNFLELWLGHLARLPRIPPYLAARYSGLQLLGSGVTAVAHSHNPSSWSELPAEIPEALRGYADAGIRVAMHPPIVDQNQLVYAERELFLDMLPPELRRRAGSAEAVDLSADDYFALLEDLYRNFHDSKRHRAHIQASPAGGQWCGDELIIRACEWARARRTRVQMHMLETRYQRIYARKTWGVSFIRHLEDIGALGDWLTLAHMVWVEDEDMELLAERGVGVAHNISSNLRLRSGIAPVAMLAAAGVPVGIGLDGQTLDDDQDFLREMRLAWTIGNQSGMAAADLDAETVWRMGAGLAADITFGAEVPLGELEVGGLADLVLLEGEAIRRPADYLPLKRLPALLLRRCRREHVRHVMVGGEWILRDGEHVSVNARDVERELWERLRFEARDLPSELEAHLRRFYRAWDDEELPPLPGQSHQNDSG